MKHGTYLGSQLSDNYRIGILSYVGARKNRHIYQLLPDKEYFVTFDDQATLLTSLYEMENELVMIRLIEKEEKIYSYPMVINGTVRQLLTIGGVGLFPDRIKCTVPDLNKFLRYKGE